MATLFSVAFTGIFLAFVIAAIFLHVLLIEAYVRPFFGRIAVAKTAPLASNLQPAR